MRKGIFKWNNMNAVGSNLHCLVTLRCTLHIGKAAEITRIKKPMESIKTRGLVLKEYEAGESDKRLLLLCKEHGRMMIYARGARKPKSKFMASAQLFTYSDFVLTAGRGFHALAQAQVIESFYGLRTDYDALTAAHLVVEVCEKTLLEDTQCDELLLLALKALGYLNKQKLPPLQVASVFFIRFFAYYGLAPETQGCTVCGEIADTEMYISAEGLICRIHKPGYGIRLSQAGVYALRHILGRELTGAFLFNARDDVIKELWETSQMLWRCHFDWKLKTTEFI